jgi:hypothetical protein
MAGQGRRRKALQRKINNGNPSIKSTRQMRTQEDTTQRKNKSKQSTKIRLKPYAKRTHHYEMPINNNREDFK